MSTSGTPSGAVSSGDGTGLDLIRRVGRVNSVVGTVVRAGVPGVRIGDLCRIKREGLDDLEAEVIGFDRQDVMLMPLGPLHSIAVRAEVEPAEGRPTVPCGPGVRGRVLDALGRPIDGKGRLTGIERAPIANAPPPPLERRPIREPLTTGVRALDAMLTVGRGQRVGIFSAAGVGKSTLLSLIARNVACDRVVLALVGERGREVRTFLDDVLGPEGLKKATVVVSTSDEPALLRLKAAHTATAIAEAERARGGDVVLLMDSVTRYARALREVGLAAGEPPGRQGYPASVFAELPRLFERAGNDAHGTMTAFYTVLVPGDDIDEPVADETMSLLDGHVILSRQLAARAHYPAVDVLRSKSRLMADIVDERHRRAAAAAADVLATWEQNYDKISLGLYKDGSDPRVDNAKRRIASVETFLRQDRGAPPTLAESVAQLISMFPG